MGTPVLLDAIRTGLLPGGIEGIEDDTLLTRGAQDTGDGLLLLGEARDGRAVVAALPRPSGLAVPDGFPAATDALEDLDLRQDELAGDVGRGGGVEEGVDVGAAAVDDGGQGGGVGLDLPDVERLGGGAGAGVAGAAQGRFGAGDEAGEFRGRGVPVEDGLVADDDELDEVPLLPRREVADLRGRAGHARGGDEDAHDHLHAVGADGGAGIGQAAAVRAVEPDAGEAAACDAGDVAGHGAGVLAEAAAGVGRVRLAPLVAVGGHGAGGGRARGRGWCWG